MIEACLLIIAGVALFGAEPIKKIVFLIVYFYVAIFVAFGVALIWAVIWRPGL